MYQAGPKGERPCRNSNLQPLPPPPSPRGPIRQSLSETTPRQCWANDKIDPPLWGSASSQRWFDSWLCGAFLIRTSDVKWTDCEGGGGGVSFSERRVWVERQVRVDSPFCHNVMSLVYLRWHILTFRVCIEHSPLTDEHYLFIYERLFHACVNLQ